MQINIKERVDVNQDGPSLIIEASPRPPNSQRCFPHIMIYCFLCCTYVSSVMRYSWHFSTSGFNIRFPKKKLITHFHQITSIFYMLLEDSFGVKYISKFSWGLEAYIKNVYEFCWPIYTNLRRPGYICGCGRPSNLVYVGICYWQYITRVTKLYSNVVFNIMFNDCLALG